MVQVRKAIGAMIKKLIHANFNQQALQFKEDCDMYKERLPAVMLAVKKLNEHTYAKFFINTVLQIESTEEGNNEIDTVKGTEALRKLCSNRYIYGEDSVSTGKIIMSYVI